MSSRSCGVLLAGLLVLAGCEGPPDGEAENPGGQGGATVVPGNPAAGSDVGSFAMSLTVGGGFQINEVSYDVSGNGFHKAGVINVAASSVVTTVVGGIPIGTGYALQLTAQDSGHKLTGCTGSATFDLPNATTVAVPVHLSCHEQPQVAAAVPVPPWARVMVGALLLALGAAAARRRGRTPV
ncbi:MAG TPA: hypothetical protein VKQ32_12290 [Polyangia bacterium]|nr:hypothetical protein [Polyangia bacterium]